MFMKRNLQDDMLTRVTVYVPVKSRSFFYLKSIESLLRQSIRPYEILVVVTFDYDGILGIISEKFPNKNIRVVKTLKPGLGFARNTALKKCKTRFLAGLDSDCVASENWLSELISFSKANNLSLCGGRLSETNYARLSDLFRKVHLRQDFGLFEIINPKFVFGDNHVIDVSAVRRKGIFFDDRFVSNYEDVDFSEKVIKAGLKTGYTPHAKVFHLLTENMRSVLDRDFNYGVYSYSLPDSFYRLLFRFVTEIYKGTRYFVSDLFSLRFRLIPVDFYLILHHCIKMAKVYRSCKPRKLSQKGNKKSEG